MNIDPSAPSLFDPEVQSSISSTDSIRSDQFATDLTKRLKDAAKLAIESTGSAQKDHLIKTKNLFSANASFAKKYLKSKVIQNVVDCILKFETKEDLTNDPFAQQFPHETATFLASHCYQ